MRALAGAILGLLLAGAALAAEPELPDLAALNKSIGSVYEAIVTPNDLVEAALTHRLVVYGEVHDQPEGARHFLELVESVRQRSSIKPRIGIEFVDRGDTDILGRYLHRTLTEEGFLERVMPTSLLLWDRPSGAHLELLRYARQHGLDIVPLESRPGGSRPMVLRNSEIRWNLANDLGRHATEPLLVLYGVDHLFGDDAVTQGLDVPSLTIAAYGDSVSATFLRRESRLPNAGEVLRLRPEVYFQAMGGPARTPTPLDIELASRETLLIAIEDAYIGEWHELGRLVYALTDPEIRWRRAAFHALRFAAQRSFGYDAEADSGGRQAAQRRWRSWWERYQKQLIGSR